MSNCTRIAVAATLLVTSLACATGCGADRQSAASLAPPADTATGPWPAAPAVWPALPTPSQLPSRRPSTLIHVVDGADCEALLQQHVAPNAALPTALDFSPQWNGTQTTSSGLACALYEFVPNLASDAPLLHLAWATAPAQGDSAWVAVADFSADRWDWHAWQAGHDIPLDLANRNVNNQGQVLAVVLVTGTHGPWRLARLRIGANQPPLAQASVDHVNQAPPYKLFVHADTSSDPDGTLVKYDYDFDGDGTFELSGVPDSTGAFNVTTEGVFGGTLRVYDDDGAMAETTFNWTTDYHLFWQAFPTADGSTNFKALCAGPAGGYYAGGGTPTTPGTGHALLVRFNADGSAIWARSLSSPKSDYIEGLAPAADGGVFVSALVNATGLGDDQLIARYAPDGTLLWQKLWSGYAAGGNSSLAVDTVNGKLYVATGFLQQVTGFDAALLQFDVTGQWNWTRVWGATGNETAAGVGLTPDGNVLLGCFNQTTDYGGVLVKLQPDGTQLTKLRYTQAGTYLIPKGLAVRGDGVIALYGYEADGAGTGAPYCISLDSSLALRWGLEFPNLSGVNGDKFVAAGFRVDNATCLAGTLKDASQVLDAALCIISDDGQTTFMRRAGPVGDDNELGGVLVAPDGGLLLAGYSRAAGNLNFNLDQLTATSLALTFTTPPENLYADLTAPTAGALVSASIASTPAPQAGAVIYKQY